MTPPMTDCRWPKQDRAIFLDAISNALSRESYTYRILDDVDFPPMRRPGWTTADGFWNEIFTLVENGVLSCLCVLFGELTRLFPFNSKLKSLRGRYPHDQVAGVGVAAKPGGRVVAGAPSPTGTIPRTKITGKVVDRLLEAAASGGRIDCVGLTGLGGMGKSIIARLAINDLRIMETFGERVNWLTLGPQCTPDRLTTLLKDHESGLSGAKSVYQTVDMAAASFMQACKERPWLIVIDDVWQPEQNDLLPYSDGVIRLVTASRRGVLPHASIRFEINPMNEDESFDLLMYSFDGEPLPSTARNIVARTGGWPLLLSLVNRTLVDRSLDNVKLETAARQVDRQLGKCGPVALDVGSRTDRNRAVEATMRVSLDALNRHFRDGEQRFLELGDRESLVIGRASLEKYWRHTADLPAGATDKLCRQLNDLSLAKYDGDDLSVAGVIHDYLRHRRRRP